MNQRKRGVRFSTRPSYMSYPIPNRGRGSHHLERERDMGLQDLHDTTLVLGLGFKPKRDDQPPATNKASSFHSSGSVGPALTLGRQSSSSHSTVSSHSDVVKRERSMDGSDGKEVDEEDGCNKKKLRLTKEQSVLLEERFKEHSSLNPKQKAALAKQLNLQPRQVEVWFQNRRARTKLKQTEVDCEFLRRCCEMLTEENRRLQNEVKELKSNTTLPPPFYVQPIPTTAVAVGVCPYCQRITGPLHDHNNTNSTKVDDKSFTTQPTSC